MTSGLKQFQKIIDPSVLYAVSFAPSTPGASGKASDASSSQLKPNIEVSGNSGHVYGSQVLPGSPPTGMTKMFDALLGITSMPYIPNYLYVDPVGSDPTAIVLTAIAADAV